MYQKITPGYEFKEGQKIRMAGREGKVKNINNLLFSHTVEWCVGDSNVTNLSNFPDLEVWIDEPKISRAAAEKIKNIRMDCEKRGTTYISFDTSIDSMVDENL
jgi:hypothetical protein